MAIEMNEIFIYLTFTIIMISLKCSAKLETGELQPGLSLLLPLFDDVLFALSWFYHSNPLFLCASRFQKTEAWEKDKTRADMEEYVWEDSPSQKNILETLLRMYPLKEKPEDEGGAQEELLGRPEVQEYKNSVTKLKNEGETESNMQQYKEAVKKLLNI